MNADWRQLSFADCGIAERALQRLRLEAICEKNQLLKESLVLQHNDAAQLDLVQEPIVGDSGHLRPAAQIDASISIVQLSADEASDRNEYE